MCVSCITLNRHYVSNTNFNNQIIQFWLNAEYCSCFLLSMRDDSIDGIYDTLKQCALISKSAGGIGVAVSCIRATGSYIAGVSQSSQIVCESASTCICIYIIFLFRQTAILMAWFRCSVCTTTRLAMLTRVATRCESLTFYSSPLNTNNSSLSFLLFATWISFTTIALLKYFCLFRDLEHLQCISNLGISTYSTSLSWRRTLVKKSREQGICSTPCGFLIFSWRGWRPMV